MLWVWRWEDENKEKKFLESLCKEVLVGRHFWVYEERRRVNIYNPDQCEYESNLLPFQPTQDTFIKSIAPDHFLGIYTERWKDKGGPSPWEGLIKTILKESPHPGPWSPKKAVYAYTCLTGPPVINDLSDNFPFGLALRKSFVFLSTPTSYSEFLEI